MKIGILTLPLHTNYGGILQAYALQTVLERMGHDARHIEIKPFLSKSEFGRFKHKFSPYKKMLKLIAVPDSKSKNIGRYTWLFVYKHIKIDEYSSIAEIPEGKYDAFVVGSDQIWRKYYVDMSDKFNMQNAFLNFTDGWNVKRISYAASFGTDKWECDETETGQLQRIAQSFDAISVREASGVELCRQNLHCDAVHLIDPTMLLDRNDYERLIKGKKERLQGIMTYILDENQKKTNVIEQLKSTLGKPTFSSNIPDNKRDYRTCGVIQPPVEDWLRGFRDADFVITDSFHACVFSIIFNKPFVVIINKERGASRIMSLLNMFKQTHRIVDEDSLLSITGELLSNPDCDIEVYRTKAFDFLNTYLS